MAAIYDFPAATEPDGSTARRPDTARRPGHVPDEVWDAVRSVRDMTRLPGVRYREIPVPASLADYGVGVGMEAGARPHLADGWIMVFRDGSGHRDGGVRWRCTAYARMPLESGERDCLTPSMYWEDMCAQLERVEPEGLGGTVTVARNTAFGTMDGENADCEIRVSWDPPTAAGGVDAGMQVRAWAGFIRSAVYDERLREQEECKR